MKCVICKTGDTAPGKATVTLERGGAVVVVKDVPADVCENCGEYYLDAVTAARVRALGEAALAQNAEVGVLRFAA
jgi:YgiT-type zinc finger domain-containing protein